MLAAEGGAMRILLIEDDAETAAFIRQGLKEHGHAVDHAADGRDGLFLATTEPYDALILDRMSPGCEPIAELAKARTVEKLDDKTLLAPYKLEVEQRLGKTRKYMT